MIAGIQIPVAARQLGHSVQVHTETYHHWINQSIQDQAYNQILSNPNRILPPP